MKGTLEHVCCARLPATALAALADLRRSPEIRVTPAGDHAWVRWEPADPAVLRRLLPVPGVALYARRDGLWYRLGARLPSFDVPDDLEGGALALSRAVTPRPIEAERPSTARRARSRWACPRDSRPRDASALACTLADLGRWAELAPSGTDRRAAGGLVGARRRVMLRGRRLPTVAGAGGSGATGCCRRSASGPSPTCPSPRSCRRLGAAEGEVVLLEADGAEAIPLDAFRPLTRAGVRLRLRGGGPPP